MVDSEASQQKLTQLKLRYEKLQSDFSKIQTQIDEETLIQRQYAQ